MKSEMIYRYSKIRQYTHGFITLPSDRPTALEEYENQESAQDDFGLFFTLQGIGRYRCRGKAQLRRDTMNFCDIIYLCHGTLELRTGGTVQVLHTGQVFVADVSKSYELLCSSEDAEILLLSYFGAVTERFGKLLQQNGICITTPQERENFEALLQNLIFYMKYPMRSSQILSLNVSTQLLTAIYISTLNPEQYTDLGQPRWLLQALEYMEKNYARRISVERLARECGLSVSHFHKLFQSSMGIAPYQYLQKLRISHAKLMLRNSAEPIKYIAYRVGIPSVNHFIAYFRKECGLTPELFRKQHEENLYMKSPLLATTAD